MADAIRLLVDTTPERPDVADKVAEFLGVRWAVGDEGFDPESDYEYVINGDDVCDYDRAWTVTLLVTPYTPDWLRDLGAIRPPATPGNVLVEGGQPHAFENPDHVRFYQIIKDRKGDKIKGKEIRAQVPGLPDRLETVIKKLPTPLCNYPRSKKGPNGGYWYQPE